MRTLNASKTELQSAFYSLWKKEMHQLFTSPAAGASFLFFFFATGIPFFYPAVPFSTADFTLVHYLSLFPLVSVLVLPAFTMGIWADERKKGTDQLLLSLPVPDVILVLGKFSALLSIYTGMLFFTIPILYFTVPVSIGSVFSSYFVLFLFGATCIALGEFLSFFFSLPVLSFLSTSAVLLVLVTSQNIRLMVDLPGFLLFFFNSISFAWHFESASRGILDSRDIAFYLLLVIAILYSHTLVIRRRRLVP